MKPLPISIPPPIAQYSIATWCLGGLLCLLLLIFRIGPQAFPRSHGLIASTSSLRYVRIRAQLLFTLGVANLVDAANHSVHFALAWRYRAYYPLVHRLVMPVTFSALPPLAILILCYRCAVIVVSEQDQRRQFVRVSQAMCLVAWILHASGVMVLTRDLLAEPAEVQLLGRWVPLWATSGSAMLPVLAIGGSVWSLRLAYDGRRRLRLQVVARGNKSTSHTGTGCDTSAKEPSSHDKVLSSAFASDRNALGSTTVTTPRTSSDQSMPAMPHPPAAPQDVSSTMRIRYPMTRTFRILTFGVFFTWVGAGLLALFPMVGPIRNNALLSLLTTLTIALESSFERLLKMQNRRKRVQQRVGRVSKDEERQDASWGSGGGNGEVVGESALDLGEGGDQRAVQNGALNT